MEINQLSELVECLIVFERWVGWWEGWENIQVGHQVRERDFLLWYFPRYGRQRWAQLRGKSPRKNIFKYKNFTRKKKFLKKKKKMRSLPSDCIYFILYFCFHFFVVVFALKVESGDGPSGQRPRWSVVFQWLHRNQLIRRFPDFGFDSDWIGLDWTGSIRWRRLPTRTGEGPMGITWISLLGSCDQLWCCWRDLLVLLVVVVNFHRVVPNYLKKKKNCSRNSVD